MLSFLYICTQSSYIMVSVYFIMYGDNYFRSGNNMNFTMEYIHICMVCKKEVRTSNQYKRSSSIEYFISKATYIYTYQNVCLFIYQKENLSRYQDLEKSNKVSSYWLTFNSTSYVLHTMIHDKYCYVLLSGCMYIIYYEWFDWYY